MIGERHAHPALNASSFPRDHHALDLRLGIVPPRPRINDGNAKSAAAIAMRAAQAKLQVEDERVRRQPVPPLEKPLMILHAAPTWAPHHNHLVRGEIAKPQPPIAFLIRRHENKIRTPVRRVYFFCTRRSSVIDKRLHDTLRNNRVRFA